MKKTAFVSLPVQHPSAPFPKKMPVSGLETSVASKCRLIALFVFIFGGPYSVWLFGQATTTGSLSGTVTDPSGSVVPHATLTLTQPSTGSKQTQTSNAEGAYIFPSVQAGAYRLSVTAQGFADSVYENIAVSVARLSNLNVSLKLGSATQEVEVNREV